MSAVDEPREPLPKRLYLGVRRFLERELWVRDVGAMPTLHAWLTRATRIVLLSVRGFFRDQCTIKAAALTYISIFSLVPVLAFGFAVAKGFGGFQEATLDSWLESTVGPEYTVVATDDGETTQVQNPLRRGADQVLELVQRTNANVLGVFGLLLLVYSVVKMLGAAERNLNEIWGASRRRSLVRRFTDYLSIAFVVPVLLLTATALQAYLRSKNVEFLWGPEVPLLNVVGPIVSLVTPWLGMAFVLGTLPNTRVRLSSALLGGVLAGSLWQLVQVLYFEGQAALTRYDAIYGSFAALPMFLLWIYLSWTSLLVGAEVGYAHASEPMVVSHRRTGRVDQRYREAFGARLAARIASAFLAGEKPPTSTSLATETGVAPRVTLEVLDRLVASGLLARTEGPRDEDGFLPARDPASISLRDLLAGLRTEPGADDPPPGDALDARVARALEALDRALADSDANPSLAELVRAVEAPREAGEPGSASGPQRAPGAADTGEIPRPARR